MPQRFYQAADKSIVLGFHKLTAGTFHFVYFDSDRQVSVKPNWTGGAFYSGAITELTDSLDAPYANKAALETAAAAFFFRVAGTALEGSSTTGVLNQTTFTIPKKVDTTKLYFAIVDQLVIFKEKGLTIVNNADDATATFSIAPEADANIDFIYSPL